MTTNNSTLLGSPSMLSRMTQQSSSGQIPYWGSFTGPTAQTYWDYDPSTTQMGQQFLNAARQYDPNAGFTQHQMGESGSPVYQLNFDQSKVPQINQNLDMNKGDYNPVYYSPTSSAGMPENVYNQRYQHNFDTSRLYNPNAISNNPILGSYTPRANLRPERPNWMDYVGPLAVGGLAGLAGGGLGLIGNVMSRAPQFLSSLTNGGGFNPLSLASAGLSFIPGINPYMAMLGRIGLNELGTQRKG